MNLLDYSDNPHIIRALRSIADPRRVRVLFVCLGNICRSPAADGLMHEAVKESGSASRWVIDSAGTGNYHIGDLPDSRMRAHARRRGLTLSHICRQVRESDFSDFDLIIGMDHSNISCLKRLAPTVEAESKVIGMAEFFDSFTTYDYVPDPYYDGAEGFELVLDLLTAATRNLRDTVEAYADSHPNSLA